MYLSNITYIPAQVFTCLLLKLCNFPELCSHCILFGFHRFRTELHSVLAGSEATTCLVSRYPFIGNISLAIVKLLALLSAQGLFWTNNIWLILILMESIFYDVNIISLLCTIAAEYRYGG